MRQPVAEDLFGRAMEGLIVRDSGKADLRSWPETMHMAKERHVHVPR